MIRKYERGYTLYELVFVLGTFSILGLLAWVIIHFITKFW